jgi:hypothetical protein
VEVALDSLELLLCDLDRAGAAPRQLVHSGAELLGLGRAEEPGGEPGMRGHDAAGQEQRQRRKDKPDRARQERRRGRMNGVQAEVHAHVLVVRVGDRVPPQRHRDVAEDERGIAERRDRGRKANDRVDDQPAEVLPGLGIGGDAADLGEDALLARAPIDRLYRLAAQPAREPTIDPGRPPKHVGGREPDEDPDDQDQQARRQRQAGDPDDEREDAGQENPPM